MENRSKKYLEDFIVGKIETIGTHSVTSEEIIEYAEKWDPQPLHIDPNAAQESEFGGLIASGSHVFAIAVRLLVLQKPRVAIIAGLGCDKVRFTHPVRPGDVLTLYGEPIQIRPSRSKADRGVVRTRITLINQNGEQVLTFIDNILVLKRSS